MLDPAEYLHKQGWKGKGTALKAGGRAHPVLIAQKKTLAGLGKDTFQAFPWWDALFAGVAKKINTPGGTESGSSTRTSTGIISPREPTGPSLGPINKHQDLIDDIRRDAAKSSLYSTFLRGKVIAPTITEDEIVNPPKEAELPDTNEAGKEPETKGQQETVEARVETAPKDTETKAERKARRKAKRLAKDNPMQGLATEDSPALLAAEPASEKKKSKKRKLEIESPHDGQAKPKKHRNKAETLP